MSDIPMNETHFMPHGTCLLWDQNLIRLHVVSDGVLTIAYLGISIWLVYFVRKRKDLPFNWIFFMLQGVFLGCGAGHLAKIWTLWNPNYWVEGYVNAATAAVSLPAAVLLYVLLPKLLAIPNTAQLTAANSKLELEIAERKQAATELKLYKTHLEELVARRTHEVNEFAYITSHDLKAPLRAINQLATWLTEDYADKLGDAGKKKCGLLMERTRHMHNMIEAILHYSRVGRNHGEHKPVHTGVAIRNVIESLAPPPHINCLVKDGSPVIFMEPVQVEQVFQNLIGNAMKYMDKPQGHIEIGCNDAKAFWEFYVKDNGPGIEERHFERIFLLFQSLNGKDGNSTGIGLTIVKKIVEAHGGAVWVESEVGTGSVFRFTVPKRPATATSTG